MIVTDQLTAWQCGECTELFRKIGMRDGDTVIDFGCGVGNYAFAAAEVVGPGGHVYALDIDPDVLNRLKAEALSRNTPNQLHSVFRDAIGIQPHITKPALGIGVDSDTFEISTAPALS
jgi:cyclopropane fatty-acyl-phospholipid synthase-like methyltransferase